MATKIITGVKPKLTGHEEKIQIDKALLRTEAEIRLMLVEFRYEKHIPDEAVLHENRIDTSGWDLHEYCFVWFEIELEPEDA